MIGSLVSCCGFECGVQEPPSKVVEGIAKFAEKFNKVNCRKFEKMK